MWTWANLSNIIVSYVSNPLGIVYRTSQANINSNFPTKYLEEIKHGAVGHLPDVPRDHFENEQLKRIAKAWPEFDIKVGAHTWTCSRSPNDWTQHMDHILTAHNGVSGLGICRWHVARSWNSNSALFIQFWVETLPLNPHWLCTRQSWDPFWLFY